MFRVPKSIAGVFKKNDFRPLIPDRQGNSENPVPCVIPFDKILIYLV